MFTEASRNFSHMWIPGLHALGSAFLLFVHRSLFWNINVLFDGPLWITFAECFFTVVVCSVRLRSSRFSIIKCAKSGILAAANEHSLNLKLPIAFSTMIICNNLCIYYMDLPMYFVSRSLAVPFSLLFVYRLKTVKKCFGVFLGAILVIVGYIFTLIEENLTNLLIVEGIIFGILASIFTVIYFQEAKTLPKANGEVHLKQVYLNNVFASGITFVAIVFSELKELRYLPGSMYIETFVFYLLVILCCIVSSYLGIVVLQETTSTSTPRREMTGLLRALLQTVLAVLIFHVYTTVFWWAGVLITAAGSAIYWRAYMAHVTDDAPTANHGDTDSMGGIDHIPLVVNMGEK